MTLGSAVLWLSSVSVTVLVCSCSVLAVNVCAIRAPAVPPAAVSSVITSSELPSPQSQVNCIVADPMFVVVFSKYIVSPSSHCVTALPPVSAS